MPANTPAPRAAKLNSLEEIQSQWFARWLCEQAQTQIGLDLTHDPMALSRIGEAAKKAQSEIETDGHAEIALPYIAADASGPKHFQLKVTRELLASARNRMAQIIAGICFGTCFLFEVRHILAHCAHRRACVACLKRTSHLRRTK